MDRSKPMYGEKFGMLEVIGRADSDKHGKAWWWCQCQCGTQKLCCGEKLRKGKLKDCGCQHEYNMRMSHWQHGYSSRAGHDATYTLWLKCRRLGTVKEWASFPTFLEFLYDECMVSEELGVLVHPFRIAKAKKHTPLGPKNFVVLD